MTGCLISRRVISLMPLHSGQVKAYWALRPHRFKALRCGRRFGKTDFAKIWIAQGLLQGEECAWFSPQHMTWSEVYPDLVQIVLTAPNSFSYGTTLRQGFPTIVKPDLTSGILNVGGNLNLITFDNNNLARGYIHPSDR